MATTKTKKYDTRKALSDYYLYVPLGAGQLFVEKTKTLSGKAFTLAKRRRKVAVRTYEDLAKRGEKLVKSIRTSAATKRAVDQTKTARSRVRAAATSVRKAVNETAGATKSAAKKVS
jgi:hypothetical protein